MKRVLLIVAIFSCMFASASAYDFKLRIVDELDSIPVEGARIEVLQQDTISKGVAYTDGYGIAQMIGLDGGEYKMKVSAEGFNPISAILNLTKDVEIGTLTIGYSGLEKATNLKEVVIEGARVTSDADKMTIVPRPQVLKGSLNTLDVLSRLHLPGVKVNAIGIQSLSIYGQAPVIKVDGVPQKLEYLNSINPEQIAKIEYTDNPTARYLQDGVGGIINVVLKKQTQGGSVWANIESAPRDFSLQGSINTTYNYKDSQFSLYVVDYWKNNQDRTEFQLFDYTLHNDDYSVTERRKREWMIPESYNGSLLNFAYQYQNRKGLMLDAKLSSGYMDDLKKCKGTLTLNDGNPFPIFRRFGSSGYNPSLDLFLIKEFQDGKSIEVNVVGSISAFTTDSHLIEENPEEIYVLDNHIKNNTKGLVSEVKWSQPIKAVKWSVGVKESYQYSHNKYRDLGEDRMHQSRTYFYTSASGNPGKLKYSAGAGVSYNFTKSNGTTDRLWLPSVAVNLTYIPIDGLRISLNSKYDPKFPALNQRTSIVMPDNPIESSTGNPELKTQHTVNARLAGMYNFGKWDFSLSSGYSYIGNYFSDREFYVGEGKFVNHAINFKNKINVYAHANVYYKELFNHLNIGAIVGIDHSVVSDANFNCSLTQPVLDVYSTGYWGKWSVSASWGLVGKTLYGYVTSENSSRNMVAVSYSPGNWQFSLSVMNIGYEKKGSFRKKITDAPNQSGVFISNQVYMGNRVSIGVSYMLQYGRSYQQKQKGLYNYIIDESVLKL